MRVHWTDNAIEHLVGIYGHISQNSPVYAKRMVEKITRRTEQISEILGTQYFFLKHRNRYKIDNKKMLSYGNG